MKIHLISAALPPALDGIGDYTAILAEELARTCAVTVLTGQPEPRPIPGAQVQTVFSYDEPRSVRGLLAPIQAAQPDWVALQYNPFSYGRWGWNPFLPRVLAQLKRRCPGVRVAVMAHEMFVPVINGKFALMALWQRRQFWNLGQAADLLGFSVAPWADAYRRRFPRKPVLHLPVFSNVPRVPMTRAQARARLGIPDAALVLGVFGSRHPSRLMDWVGRSAEAVCRRGKEPLVLFIGPDSEGVRRMLGAVPLKAEGPLPAEEVSRRLAAVDIYLAPFTDGISTRRGTLMAGLQHGLATVGTLGRHTDPMLREARGQAFLLAEAASPDQFYGHVQDLAEDGERRRRLGLEAARLYRRCFSPEVAADTLFAAMREVFRR